MTFFGDSHTDISSENISQPNYVITVEYALGGGPLDEVSEDGFPKTDLIEEPKESVLNEQDTVTKIEDESENMEDKVEERECEVELKEDEVEKIAQPSTPEEDIEVGEAFAACAPEDDVEDLTEREDYQKVMTNVLKEFCCDSVDYENGLEAHMVQFITDYVYSVLEDASLYSAYAKKKEIDMKDVELAMSMLQVKNGASSWDPVLAQTLTKQRTVIQSSKSINFTLPGSPHESETASTGDTDADVSLDAQEKDYSGSISEHDPILDKDTTIQTKESESPSSGKNAPSSSYAGCSSNTDEDSVMDIDDPSTSTCVGSSMSTA